jgi:lambda family phage tail tape measure protein
MSGTKAQLEFTADASGVEAGVAKAKRSLADMGASAVKEGKKPSDGLASIGKGADQAAVAVDSATKNLINNVQRTIAATEAGAKSGRKFYESLAVQRGANVDVLRPYLDQLDAVTAKTKAATAAASKLTTSLGASDFGTGSAIPKKLSLSGAADPALKAATTSLGASAFGDYAAKTVEPLKQIGVEAAKAAASATASLQKVGVSAGQTKQALAQLPAQFSDIVVSLQGGQRPLSVLLQQGSQIKDSFGGVVPAFKAVGGAVLAMVTPFSVAAGAVGILGTAMLEGSAESTAYAKALTLTGNSIGKTTEQLQAMAANIAKTTGTQGDAAEALAALAGSGKIATSALNDVGAAVVSMNRVLGMSVDKAVDVFEKLADEPSKASAKLNEQMHYLNLTTYERIRALEEQGSKEEATALAQRTYAQATTSRLSEVEAQAGVLARAWRMLAHDAKEAWDLMMGLGRTKTTGEMLTTAQQNLEALKARGPIGGPVTGKSDYETQLRNAQAAVSEISRKALREQDAAIAQGEKAKTDAAQIGASQRIKILDDETKTNSDKRKKAIAELDRDFKTLGKPTSGAEYDKLVSNINDKYKDPKGAAVKAVTDDAGTKMLEQLRQQEASLKDQLAQEGKITDEQKAQAKFVQLIADLKDKKILTADQKSLLSNQDAIKSQLDKNVVLSNEITLKNKIEEIDNKAKEAAKEMARTFAGINLSMESANAGRSDQYGRILATAGLGDRARQQVLEQREIYNEFQRATRQATKAASESPGGLESDDYKKEIAQLTGYRDEGLKILKDFYTQDAENRGNWVLGVREAFANYSDEASDAAKHSKEAFGNAMKGVEDQLTSLFTGGKFDAKKLFEGIGTDLTRNFVKEKITGPLSDLAGKALGDGGALGGLFGAKGGQLGSTATNPLYVRLADSLGSLGAAASGSSGGGLLGLLGTVVGGFGGVDAQASVASALPGDALDNIIKLTRNFAKFSGGGYTGAGGKFDPAGIVHAGEYVITAESTKKLGVDFLDRLNSRGYANGGYVGEVMGGSLRQGSSGAAVSPVQVTINNTVGNVATLDDIRKSQRDTEQRIVAGLQRSRTMGGAAA